MAAPISREELQEEFNKIDLDGNGTLSYEEFLQFSKALPNELSTSQINKIYKHMDLDGDSKVTFDEFYEWWTNKENKMLALLYAKQMFQKKASKVSKKVASTIKEGSDAGGQKIFKANLKAGEPENKTEIVFNSSTIKSSLPLYEQVREVLNLQDDSTCIVLKLKVSKDIEEAKTILKDLVEQAKELAQCILPPEVADTYISLVDIKVESFQDQYLLLSVSCQHPLIEGMQQQYSQIVNQIAGQEQGTSIEIKLASGFDLQNVVDTPSEQNIIAKIAQGFNLSFNLNSSNRTRENLMSLLHNNIEASFEPDAYVSSKRRQQRMFKIVASLLSGISINLQAKDVFEVLSTDKFSHLSLNRIISNIRNKADLTALVQKLPIFQDVIDFMMGYSESEIGIQLISPSLGVELFAKTQNISSLYQKIMANEDAEEIV